MSFRGIGDGAFVQSADNKFYSAQDPVYTHRTILSGSADITNENRKKLCKGVSIDKNYLSPNRALVRALLIVHR
jgi:hypothetical protein